LPARVLGASLEGEVLTISRPDGKTDRLRIAEQSLTIE